MSEVASPQLEDGYTRIANELFDAILAFPFSARQMKVVMTLVRKTYGYNKKRDDISASQIGDACGVARNHVTSTLNELVALGVIYKAPGTHGMLIEINKNYRQWASPKSGQVSQIGTSPESGQRANGINELAGSPESGLVPNQDATSPESGQVDSPESGHTKDNLPKDNQQKTGAPAEADQIFVEAWAAYPKRDGGNSKTDALKAWKARVREGVLPADMLAGVKRYASHCAKNDMLGSRFVKQASTFFGPGGHYTESWGAAMNTSEDWWVKAGFDKQWQAENAGCTETNAWLWREGRPTKKLAGVEIEPWEVA